MVVLNLPALFFIKTYFFGKNRLNRSAPKDKGPTRINTNVENKAEGQGTLPSAPLSALNNEYDAEIVV
jgi:hypothetical protein